RGAAPVERLEPEVGERAAPRVAVERILVGELVLAACGDDHGRARREAPRIADAAAAGAALRRGLELGARADRAAQRIALARVEIVGGAAPRDRAAARQSAGVARVDDDRADQPALRH